MDHLSRVAKFFCLSCLALLSLTANAAPIPVDVGIYINNIPAVNLKEKNFLVDFNVWFRWQDDSINPADTFKIFNGSVDAKETMAKKKVGDANYVLQHVQATIYRNFDVARYPLDNHTLKIQIEDGNFGGTPIVYVPDQAHSNIGPRITVPGWRVGKFEAYSSVTSYKTGFGDLSLPDTAEVGVPRYTFAVDLAREGYGFFLKYFSTLFLSVAITIGAFWIPSNMIDTRFWLVMSSFFLAVITGGSLATTLPETEYFGLGDQLYHLTLTVLFIATLAMIHQHHVAAAGRGHVNRLSAAWGIGIALLYVLLSALIVMG